jgi:type I restriction enzyme M protein
MNISSTIKSIQDIMRKDDGVDGDAQRIGQLTWMLFLKVFDQKEEEWEDDAKDKKKQYHSPLPADCRWRNWASYITDKEGKKKPQIQGSDLLKKVNEDIFPKLKELDSTEELTGKGVTKEDKIRFQRSRKVIRQVFKDTNNYMKSGQLMLGVIEKLEDAIDFHDFKSRQNLGDIYEQILSDLRSAGNAGEFYTPRAITQFMVDRVNPSLKGRETVLDPACGTGGFLTATITHLQKQLPKKASAEDGKAVEESIFGYEKKQLPHLLCVTNMLLHGIDVPDQIDHRNTLAKPWNEWSKNDRVDCVITNPPFGGMEDDGVGNDIPSDVRTRETADMFLVLIIDKLLKDGGRGAIVLPDGTLFGEGVKNKIKEKLLNRCNLHTIIRLPNGVFSPYTGIKTNLLFFTKGKPTETIWYYEHPYPDGTKSYNKTKPIRFEEFANEISWWGKEKDGFSSRVENEFAWKVDFKAKKEDAENRAKPHRKKAEELNNQAKNIEQDIKELNSQKKSESGKKLKELEQKIDTLREEADKLKNQARDEQAAGDRIYWLIYNLNSDNPKSPEVEKHDPDILLEKYKSLLLGIENTQNELKTELASALSHHF